MKTASQRFSNVLKKGLIPILKINGFKRQGHNFYKSLDDISHTINIQKDKWSTKDEIKFTFNVGIFSNKYWLSEFDFDNTGFIPAFPKESESIIRKRIGELKFGDDYWYSVESQRLERKLIKDVENDIKEFVLPFLNTINTTKDLINHLKSIQTISENNYKLFIMLAEEGLMDEAQVIFNQIMKQCEERHIDHMEERRIKYKLK